MRRLRAVVTIAAVLCVGLVPGPDAGGAPSRSPRPQLATPQLIERAEARGDISTSTANLYLAYALAAPDKLPRAYRSGVAWDGTLTAKRLTEALETMPPGAVRSEIDALMHPVGGPGGPGTDTCLFSVSPMPATYRSKHFYIEYNPTTLRAGLTIRDYARSLEGAWRKEVNRFGWARPPVLASNPPPGRKYHVRIDEITPVLYGFVSNEGTHAGEVGNNPATRWNDRDAQASCMVLNADYEGLFFPGGPYQALNATTAHEFAHSLQYGIGALHGRNEPDGIFVEGGATWMEDEVYDGSNDNHNYLWPRFRDDMGEYDHSPYPYWIVFRGLTERFGTNRAGAGEDVMQMFFELTSKNKGSNLGALGKAMRRHGVTLARAYHSYAIAVKFNRRCRGDYDYPRCFEEGPKYVKVAGYPKVHRWIKHVGGVREGTIPDNFALNWVALPREAGRYAIRLSNHSRGGKLRATAVCDTGSGFRIFRFHDLLTKGERETRGFRSGGCDRAVLVITNQKRTANNPDRSQDRRYRVKTFRRS